MPEIVLYEFEISPFCEKVRRALAYKKLAYRKVECGAMTPGQLKKINPRRKMPALTWDGHKLLDSSDILAFIERQAPTPSLSGDNAAERALAHLLEDWADESLIWHEVYMRFHVEPAASRMAAKIAKHLPVWMKPIAPQIVLPMIRRMGQVQGVARKPRDVVEAELRRHYAMLDQLLTDREFLTSGHPTNADVAVSSMLWGLIDAGHWPVIAEYKNLAAWYERVTALVYA